MNTTPTSTPSFLRLIVDNTRAPSAAPLPTSTIEPIGELSEVDPSDFSLGNWSDIAPNVAILRKKLVTETDQAVIMQHFMDMSGNEAFIHSCTFIEDEPFLQILRITVHRTLGRSPELLSSMHMGLPEHELSHGLLDFKGYKAMWFFFHDMTLGILALVPTSQPGPVIHCRFGTTSAFNGLRASQRGAPPAGARPRKQRRRTAAPDGR